MIRRIGRVQPEGGQITILLALSMSMLMIFAIFVVDGGYALVQNRRTQNASDFASMAASGLMPCSVGANSTVTAAQIQSTVNTLVNDNMGGSTNTWTAKYLNADGSSISGATFSSTTASSPPAAACGVQVQVNGTYNTFLAKFINKSTLNSQTVSGATGNGVHGYSLAIASLLPYARHTIYAGAVGQFTVNGSMYDNSVAQCNDRDDSCLNYSECNSGTPRNNIVCYGDSADVFQSASEAITGTLYSRAPVAIDPCFYVAPTSGAAYPMASSSTYYNSYGCNGQFSSAFSPISYGAMAGNASALTDPLANLDDPSTNGDAATICPSQSAVSTNSGGIYSSGNLTPGVYTGTVTITGSVTFLPCQTSGVTTAPGVYVFQKGLEICPATSGQTVTASDVMLYNQDNPPSADSDANPNSSGYCAAANGSSSSVPDGITVGGVTGTTVNISAPNTGAYQGIALYQDRGLNQNIGLDDGWTQSGTTQNPVYTADGSTINITGVVYDNSYTNESSTKVFSYIGETYQGPYGSLCTGTTNVAYAGDPVPCAGASGISTTSGSVSITGAVIVGAFGTQGGSTSHPITLTITFDASAVPTSVGNVRLSF